MSSIFPQQPKVPLLEQIRANIARNFPQPTESGMKTNARNVTSVATGQMTVTVNPQQVNLVSRNCIAVKLTNLSATTEIWWSTIPGLVPGTGNGGNGDLLPSGRGSWISIPGASVIWVAVASGSALMSWAEKYDEGENNAEF